MADTTASSRRAASRKALEDALADLKVGVVLENPHGFVPAARRVISAIEDAPEVKNRLEEYAGYVEAATRPVTAYSVAFWDMQEHLQDVTPNPPKPEDVTGCTLVDPLDELQSMPSQLTTASHAMDA